MDDIGSFKEIPRTSQLEPSNSNYANIKENPSFEFIKVKYKKILDLNFC